MPFGFLAFKLNKFQSNNTETEPRTSNTSMKKICVKPNNRKALSVAHTFDTTLVLCIYLLHSSDFKNVTDRLNHYDFMRSVDYNCHYYVKFKVLIHDLQTYIYGA